MRAGFDKTSLMAQLEISGEISTLIMDVIYGRLNPMAFTEVRRAMRRKLLFSTKQLDKHQKIMYAISQLIRSWGIEPIINKDDRVIAYYCNSLGLDEMTIIWDNINNIVLLKSVNQFLKERHIVCKNLTCLNGQ